MGVSVPKQWQELRLEEMEQKLGELSQCVRSTLRQYDSCYRLNNNNFIILFPQSDDESTQAIQLSLQRAINKNPKMTEKITVPMITTSPEDDVVSLLKKLEEKLHES